MPFFCISDPAAPESEHKLNADVLFVSDSMEPPIALSCRLLEPLDTSLKQEQGWGGKKHNQIRKIL